MSLSSLANTQAFGRGIRHNVVGYFLILTICGFIIWFTITVGRALNSPTATASIHKPETLLWSTLKDPLHDNLRGPLGILLMQIVVVVLAGRILSFIASRFQQPPVIGEMLAGILLGPSFLGLMSPAAMGFLFPHHQWTR